MSRLRTLIVLLAVGLLPVGCGGIPLGPIGPPEIYPDRTEDHYALHTFLHAWNTGDIPVLRGVVGAYLALDLEKQIEANGEEATSAFYRGKGDMTVQDMEWQKRGDSLAYARLVLLDADSARFEMRISLLRRPDGWVVTARKPLR